MFEPLYAWWLNIPKLEFDPSIVVHVALAVDAPRFYTFRAYHAHGARYQVGTTPSYFQGPFGNEAREHLP